MSLGLKCLKFIQNYIFEFYIPDATLLVIDMIKSGLAEQIVWTDKLDLTIHHD